MSEARSLLLRREIVEALRRGTVPERGLEMFAVGMERFEKAFDEELGGAAAGRGVFKAIRGEYGCGKSFVARWLQQRAIEQGFAVAEVQISANDTPLHRLETVYRRAMESLRTREWNDGAFRAVIDEWFLSLEEEVEASDEPIVDAAQLSARVGELLEARLREVSATQPQFAAALRAVHRARVTGDPMVHDGLLGWLMGQPHIGAKVKRAAGLRGDVDHTAALAFLRGMLTVLKQVGKSGLVLVLDEIETIQRVRSDVRERSLNALRQIIDLVYNGRFPGLYVLITGTPAFFDGPAGVRRLEPLAQRLHVDFGPEPRFDSTRAIQVRLQPFGTEQLVQVGRKIRDLYPTEEQDRVRQRVNDDVVDGLARKVAAGLGGKVGIAPRIFLKKLVGDVLDRVDEHPDFDPTVHYELSLSPTELRAEELEAAGMELTANDIELDLSESEASEL